METNNYNFIEELKKYFKTHTREEVLKDWESVQEWDNVGIPVNKFLSELEQRLTTALRNETKESLTQWINEKRKRKR